MKNAYFKRVKKKKKILDVIYRSVSFLADRRSRRSVFLGKFLGSYVFSVWIMLHRGSVGRVQNKQCYFMYADTFMILFSGLLL